MNIAQRAVLFLSLALIVPSFFNLPVVLEHSESTPKETKLLLTRVAIFSSTDSFTRFVRFDLVFWACELALILTTTGILYAAVSGGGPNIWDPDPPENSQPPHSSGSTPPETPPK